jgi:hypothetical protein
MAKHIGAYVRVLRKLLVASAICLTGMGKAQAEIPPSDVPGNFAWNPGLMSKGGIPNRTSVCATLSPSGGDDSAAIQAALDKCPDNQVVMLKPGTFIVNNYVGLTHPVVLRGSGAGVTILKKTNGARPRTKKLVPGTNVYKPIDPGGAITLA